jgi:hypothetical protein
MKINRIFGEISINPDAARRPEQGEARHPATPNSL